MAVHQASLSQRGLDNWELGYSTKKYFLQENNIHDNIQDAVIDYLKSAV